MKIKWQKKNCTSQHTSKNHIKHKTDKQWKGILTSSANVN